MIFDSEQTNELLRSSRERIIASRVHSRESAELVKATRERILSSFMVLSESSSLIDQSLYFAHVRGKSQ